MRLDYLPAETRAREQPPQQNGNHWGGGGYQQNHPYQQKQMNEFLVIITIYGLLKSPPSEMDSSRRSLWFNEEEVRYLPAEN